MKTGRAKSQMHEYLWVKILQTYTFILFCVLTRSKVRLKNIASYLTRMLMPVT